MFDFLKGKKTYITAAVTAAVAVADVIGQPVPSAAYGILVALGLVNARRGATREARKQRPY